MNNIIKRESKKKCIEYLERGMCSIILESTDFQEVSLPFCYMTVSVGQTHIGLGEAEFDSRLCVGQNISIKVKALVNNIYNIFILDNNIWNIFIIIEVDNFFQGIKKHQILMKM